jgi:hypothetical protein
MEYGKIVTKFHALLVMHFSYIPNNGKNFDFDIIFHNLLTHFFKLMLPLLQKYPSPPIVFNCGVSAKFLHLETKKKKKRLTAPRKTTFIHTNNKQKGNGVRPKTNRVRKGPTPLPPKNPISFLIKYSMTTKRIGLLPMASPLFSGFIPATWFLKLDSVSPDQGRSQSEKGGKLNPNQSSSKLSPKIGKKEISFSCLKSSLLGWSFSWSLNVL